MWRCFMNGYLHLFLKYRRNNEFGNEFSDEEVLKKNVNVDLLHSHSPTKDKCCLFFVFLAIATIFFVLCLISLVVGKPGQLYFPVGSVVENEIKVFCICGTNYNDKNCTNKKYNDFSTGACVEKCPAGTVEKFWVCFPLHSEHLYKSKPLPLLGEIVKMTWVLAVAIGAEIVLCLVVLLLALLCKMEVVIFFFIFQLRKVESYGVCMVIVIVMSCLVSNWVIWSAGIFALTVVKIGLYAIKLTKHFVIANISFLGEFATAVRAAPAVVLAPLLLSVFHCVLYSLLIISCIFMAGTAEVTIDDSGIRRIHFGAVQVMGITLIFCTFLILNSVWLGVCKTVQAGVLVSWYFSSSNTNSDFADANVMAARNSSRSSSTSATAAVVTVLRHSLGTVTKASFVNGFVWIIKSLISLFTCGAGYSRLGVVALQRLVHSTPSLATADDDTVLAMHALTGDDYSTSQTKVHQLYVRHMCSSIAIMRGDLSLVSYVVFMTSLAIVCFSIMGLNELSGYIIALIVSSVLTASTVNALLSPVTFGLNALHTFCCIDEEAAITAKRRCEQAQAQAQTQPQTQAQAQAQAPAYTGVGGNRTILPSVPSVLDASDAPLPSSSSSSPSSFSTSSSGFFSPPPPSNPSSSSSSFSSDVGNDESSSSLLPPTFLPCGWRADGSAVSHYPQNGFASKGLKASKFKLLLAGLRYCLDHGMGLPDVPRWHSLPGVMHDIFNDPLDPDDNLLAAPALAPVVYGGGAEMLTETNTHAHTGANASGSTGLNRYASVDETPRSPHGPLFSAEATLNMASTAFPYMPYPETYSMQEYLPLTAAASTAPSSQAATSSNSPSEVHVHVRQSV